MLAHTTYGVFWSLTSEPCQYTLWTKQSPLPQETARTTFGSLPACLPDLPCLLPGHCRGLCACSECTLLS